MVALVHYAGVKSRASFLLEALKHGNGEMVEYFARMSRLPKDQTVGCRDKVSGFTCLHYVASQADGRYNVLLDKLLAVEVNVNVLDAKARTPHAMAVESGNGLAQNRIAEHPSFQAAWDVLPMMFQETGGTQGCWRETLNWCTNTPLEEWKGVEVVKRTVFRPASTTQTPQHCRTSSDGSVGDWSLMSGSPGACAPHARHRKTNSDSSVGSLNSSMRERGHRRTPSGESKRNHHHQTKAVTTIARGKESKYVALHKHSLHETKQRDRSRTPTGSPANVPSHRRMPSNDSVASTATSSSVVMHPHDGSKRNDSGSGSGDDRGPPGLVHSDLEAIQAKIEVTGKVLDLQWQTERSGSRSPALDRVSTPRVIDGMMHVEVTTVTALALGSNGLQGLVPVADCLARLTELCQLYLNSNSLSGRFPTEFGHLVNLQYL